MAKKKAQKKKKQQARVQSAPKPKATATDQTSYVESATPVVTTDAGSTSQSDWGWTAYAGLALAALIILVAGWLVVGSLGSKPPTTEDTSGGSPIPLSGQANPEQLQSGGTNVQQGAPIEDGNSSSANGGLQPQQPITPEQLKSLQ